MIVKLWKRLIDVPYVPGQEPLFSDLLREAIQEVDNLPGNFDYKYWELGGGFLTSAVWEMSRQESGKFSIGPHDPTVKPTLCGLSYVERTDMPTNTARIMAAHGILHTKVAVVVLQD